MAVFGAITSLLAAGPAAASRLSVYESTLYYDIEGRTKSVLLQEMYDKGPDSLYSVGEALGSTEVHFSSHASFREENDMCGIGSIDVTIQITFHMPRWLDRDKANKKLKKEWDDFMEGLWNHERGHAQIARSGGELMLKHLTKIPPQENCDVLSEKVDAIIDGVIKGAVNPAQRKYDKVSHGWGEKNE